MKVTVLAKVAELEAVQFLPVHKREKLVLASVRSQRQLTKLSEKHQKLVHGKIPEVSRQ